AHRAAGGGHGFTGTRGELQALQADLLAQLAGLDHLDGLRAGGNEALRLEHRDVDIARRLDLLQVGQPDLGGQAEQRRVEAALGQATLDRHLAALEALLAATALASALTLVTASRGLAHARTDAAADADADSLAAFGRLDRVEFHGVR